MCYRKILGASVPKGPNGYMYLLYKLYVFLPIGHIIDLSQYKSLVPIRQPCYLESIALCAVHYHIFK